MKDYSGRYRPRPVRSRWTGVLLTVAGLALLAACGSSGTTTSGGNTQSAAYTKALAYAKCIRSHGVPNFPDPNSDGTFTENGNNANSLGNISPQVINQATSACQSLAPGGGQISQAQKQQVTADGLKFARCMRTHGVPTFPDPTSGGEIGLPHGTNPNSPTFQNAERACQSLMPQQAP
jgi:hypothetical protein